MFRRGPILPALGSFGVVRVIEKFTPPGNKWKAAKAVRHEHQDLTRLIKESSKDGAACTVGQEGTRERQFSLSNQQWLFSQSDRLGATVL